MAVRVLVVDDLPFMRQALRDVLTEDGFEIVGEAEDGIEGILRYAETHPDVVLLDIAMPRMDGLTALKKLMRFDAAARVVMCSALGEQSMIVKAIQLGARDFVVKPFRPERVVSAIRKVVKS